MASLKLVLYKSKKLSGDCYPVALRITYNRKPKYLSLTTINKSLKCRSDQWYEGEEDIPGGFRKNLKNSGRYNGILHNNYWKAKDIIDRFSEKNQPFSWDNFLIEFTGVKKGMTLFKFFDLVIENLNNSEKIGNANIYKDCYNTIRNFRNKKDLEFVDINYSLISRLVEYMRSNKNAENTIYVRLRTLRALLNEAIAQKYMNDEYYPFARHQAQKNRYVINRHNESTRHRALKKEDIISIKDIDLSKQPHLIDARNYFIFSYAGYGINFVDIALLCWEDIKTVGGVDRVFYKRKKLKNSKKSSMLNFKLNPVAWEIINYYSNVDSIYIFPILNENVHRSESQIINRVRKVRKQVNKDLGTIADILELDERNITTYWARHSAASILKNQNTPIALISDLLGHTSEKTTQIYLDQFDSGKQDEAQDKLF